MSWQDILKSERDYDLREMRERREDKAASYDKPFYDEDEEQEYYLMLESYSRIGYDMEHLDKQETFTGSLEEAKEWAVETWNKYSDDIESQFEREWEGSTFVLYDEDDNWVYDDEHYESDRKKGWMA